MTLSEIQTLTARHAAARAKLEGILKALRDEIGAARKKKAKSIKDAVEAVRSTKEELHQGISASPDQFFKPRTRVIEGLKVGIEKGKGRISWSDEETVIRRIKGLSPERLAALGVTLDLLVRTTEKPNRSTLNQLPAGELKKLGVTVEEAGDQVVIRPVQDELEKLVKALIEDDEETTEEEAA